jgi:hypothetical protein
VIGRPKAKATVAERLALHSKDGPNGCRLWTGGLTGRLGYGTLNIAGKTVGAHRAAWMVAHGPIPKRMCVCHRCDVRHCINPDHLWLGTHQQNIADRVAKGRHRVAYVAPPPKRTAASRAAERIKAQALFARGKSASAVAAALDISRSKAYSLKRRPAPETSVAA